MYGKVFFGARVIRDWTYGEKNQKNETYMFESEFIAEPDQRTTIMQVALKQMKASVPFEAEVHFEGVNFSQVYSGIWNGLFSYEYEFRTFDPNAPQK